MTLLGSVQATLPAGGRPAAAGAAGVGAGSLVSTALLGAGGGGMGAVLLATACGSGVAGAATGD